MFECFQLTVIPVYMLVFLETCFLEVMVTSGFVY